MIPGTILCDDEFTFSDGSTGKKLLIVLNDGSDGVYIVVKTTSKSDFKGNDYGCQSSVVILISSVLKGVAASQKTLGFNWTNSLNSKCMK